ncbi:Sodium/hydrogen exchanger 7 [Tetrabaena socialis]|uniref:Sodium/hydrogen exchanger 7 n=1 Tax=Tetrabaena socialis TaxID=47790 RepID=A0A2J7ZZ81_9CHLO|nr:Sodium/hydrogen exchanger 7 [Tetrabaena socialis]|eukprot:PNH05577.1 Sodium/hydrogen exchanger 7 [Tetrabaena socialis]
MADDVCAFGNVTYSHRVDDPSIVLFDIFLRKVLQERRSAAASSDGFELLGQSDAADAGYRHRAPPPLAPSPDPAGPWPPLPIPPWLAALGPELAAVGREAAWLVVGGVVVGYSCALLMKWGLRFMQWRRLKPHVEVSLTLAVGYLAFYVANAYLQASGVIAVVVLGVYGAATGMWGLSSQARRTGAFDRFWDVLGFIINSLVFFLLGASSVNYIIRLGAELDSEGSASQSLLYETLLQLPVVYIVLFGMRGVLIAAFCYVARRIATRRFKRRHPAALEAGGQERSHKHHQAPPARTIQQTALAATPDWRGIIFATVGGLRGAVSLIMAQIVLAAVRSSEVYESAGGPDAAATRRRDKEVTAQMVVWASGFVLMSLVLNAPLLTPLMALLRLNTESPITQQAGPGPNAPAAVRARAKSALRRFTANALKEMKAAAELADGMDGSGGPDMSLMLLRGVDWSAVEREADLSRKLDLVFPSPQPATHAPPAHQPAPSAAAPTAGAAAHQAGAAAPPSDFIRNGLPAASGMARSASKRYSILKRVASRRGLSGADSLREPLLSPQQPDASNGEHEDGVPQVTFQEPADASADVDVEIGAPVPRAPEGGVVAAPAPAEAGGASDAAAAVRRGSGGGGGTAFGVPSAATDAVGAALAAVAASSAVRRPRLAAAGPSGAAREPSLRWAPSVVDRDEQRSTGRSAYDAVLFAGVALLVACVVAGKLSAVWVLAAGALVEVASYHTNLGRFGNSVTLWLGGIHPGEVFFYTFLPPLLLESAARLDYFVFKQVLVLSLVFAFVLVCTSTLLAVPLMLWGMGLGTRYGWRWTDVALFNAMVAATDAVAGDYKPPACSRH